MDALIEHRGIRAGLDVYPDEPGSGATEWSSKLAQHPNVVGTHHIGASTEQAQKPSPTASWPSSSPTSTARSSTA